MCPRLLSLGMSAVHERNTVFTIWETLSAILYFILCTRLWISEFFEINSKVNNHIKTKSVRINENMHYL